MFAVRTNTTHGIRPQQAGGACCVVGVGFVRTLINRVFQEESGCRSSMTTGPEWHSQRNARDVVVVITLGTHLRDNFAETYAWLHYVVVAR